jgi:hypothetical protein
VREFQEAAFELPLSASIFDAMQYISTYDYVLVRGFDKIISGIVTGDDLAILFQQMTEPFLLVSEIEIYLRSLLRDVVTSTQLKEFRARSYGGEPLNVATECEFTLDSLSFGENIRLLDRDDVWNQTAFCPFDRRYIVDRLDKIRVIRNEIMHFNPDPNEYTLDELRKFSQFIRIVKNLV